jgi:hypothetical protein
MWAGLAAWTTLSMSSPALAEPNAGGDFGHGLHLCAFGEGGYGYRVGEVNCPGGAVLCTNDHEVMCCRPNDQGGRDCQQIIAPGRRYRPPVAPTGALRQSVAPQPTPAPPRPPPPSSAGASPQARR